MNASHMTTRLYKQSIWIFVFALIGLFSIGAQAQTYQLEDIDNTLTNGFAPVTDSAGSVYVTTNTTPGQILKYNWNGSSYDAPVAVVSGLSNPIGLSIDASNNLYVSNSGTNSLLRYDWNGATYNPAITVASGTMFIDVAVDSAGNVYATSMTVVNKFTPSGATTYNPGVQIITGLNQGSGIDLDAAGNIYIANAGTNEVRIYNPAGTLTTTIPGQPGAMGMAVDAAGNMYVSHALTGDVYQIPAGGGTAVLVATGITDVRDIWVNPAGTIVYIASQDGLLRAIRPQAGGNTVISVPAGSMPGVLLLVALMLAAALWQKRRAD